MSAKIGKDRPFAFCSVRRFAAEDSSSSLLRRMLRYHRQTYEHTIRVAGYAWELAAELGLPPAERDVVLRSALLHDIGKLEVPLAVLDKPGSLLPEEWDAMRSHCRRGDALIRLAESVGPVDSEMIVYHHENVDGSGYYGVPGAMLNVRVKLLRVVDSFDAMTVDRGYNRPRTREEALAELTRCRGRLYDPDVTDAFSRIVYRAG
ncbi:HD-GYP domain-containing protein [Paenibacillus flagellatus]|uniref:HD-GYP domain-containing protein n=1 Tax=Paenibacillus flagellatus TaxID=2211139 RepID=UPI0013052305|nr:HD domain-containing phosphohydrolase [Paenibacillus flagellatus]